MSLHLNLVDFELFINIANANSLTRGAELSHMSLPAASTRIKNIEESLDAKLFYRSCQGVTLTLPGQAFLHHARLVIRQIESLRGDLQEYIKGVKGHLRMFANTTAITEFLPTVLSSFLINHPNVSVDLQEYLSPDVVRSVIEGKADIGIVAGEVRTESLQTIPYRNDQLVLAIPKGHSLTIADTASFKDALNFDFVGLHETSAIQTFLTQIANGLHKALKMRIKVGNFEAVCRMVEADVGIAVLPLSAARRHAKTMDIRIIALQDSWSLRNLQICVRDIETLPTFARELVDILIADGEAASDEN